MDAVEYLKIEQRCKSWCISKCRSNGGCESCCYHKFCWVDAIEPEEYVRFYTLWAREHPEKKHKTYLEDFFEKFPNAEPKYYDGRGKKQMIPKPCRQHCYGVVGQKCNGIGCSCSACWNEEMKEEK